MTTLTATIASHVANEPGEALALSLSPAVTLTCEQIEQVSLAAEAWVEFSDQAWEGMRRSCATLAAAREAGQPIYGLSTGFGPHVKYAASQCADEQGAGLIAHLGAGVGPWAGDQAVIATMLIRAKTLAAGLSGVAPEVASSLMAILNARVCPMIPEIGSVGASGDLIPLSFIARVLMGEGQARVNGKVLAGREALASADLTPLSLSGRDALALVNGTAFMTAFASLALARAQRLVERAEQLTGWIYRSLGCRAQALDPRLHAARGHVNQGVSADRILAEARSQGAWEDTSRPLQEVYSLRCAPQFLGACRDQLDHARNLIEREINGVSDNPVVWTGDEVFPEEAVLHGGNFQGQQIAFASDAINSAVVQAAVLAERQLDVLLNPEFNGAAPLLLAWQPGATSGMAGGQITATAIVAEMRHHGGPVATSSIPTNGRNQDVVSMGTLAARAAFGQTARLANVLAILATGVTQLHHLRQAGRAAGRVAPAPAWMPDCRGFEKDRPLHDDIERISSGFLTPPGL